jgi:hypothetical protein
MLRARRGGTGCSQRWSRRRCHETTDGGILLDLRDLKTLEIDVEGRNLWADPACLPNTPTPSAHTGLRPASVTPAWSAWAVSRWAAESVACPGGCGNFGVVTPIQVPAASRRADRRRHADPARHAYRVDHDRERDALTRPTPGRSSSGSKRPMRVCGSRSRARSWSTSQRSMTARWTGSSERSGSMTSRRHWIRATPVLMSTSSDARAMIGFHPGNTWDRLVAVKG